MQGKHPGDPWEDFFGSRDGAPEGARELFISALSRLPEPPFPHDSLERACRSLRGALRWGEPPCDLLLAAGGLEAERLPREDLDLWMMLAAGTISPRRPIPGQISTAWDELDDADWLGATLYMARGGPGTPTMPGDLLSGIVLCPETRGDIDTQHARAITQAFEAVGPLWRVLGVVGSAQEGRPLTTLGHWGLPLALLRAWEAR
ncbi:MAG TPA: hypothetical protein VGR49_07645 [Actinomycetota bacterium]|nr:hypothetical protein [Actinomycetota bacterium]